MDEMEEMEEERGISIGEIFKVIFKRAWWVLGVTVAFLLAFVLVVQLWYNHSKSAYNLQYTIEYPDSDTGLYPDGTAFRLSDVISLKTLNQIKAS
ncbi:MAG: hypothetical protein ACI4L9_06330, partial [Candidatus Coproplasma sp.]